jgi:hypothetical protein
MIHSFDIGWWEVTVAGVSTLAIYSFLYRENPLYRFFEHFFIGIATSITIMKFFRDFLWPTFFKPMLGYDRVVFPDGSFSEPYNVNYLLYLLPMAFGLLYYFILSKRLSWLAQLPIGLALGVGAGLSFKGFFNEMMPQLYDSFRPLYIEGDLTGSVTNIVFILTLLCSLSYFFFSFKRKEGGLVERASSAGRLMMMCCFGAFFGSTIMARMALLVERLEFLINEWSANVFFLS